jgi:NSS family neurotransmitter:Na+ symporter
VGGFFIALFAGWMLTRQESGEEFERGSENTDTAFTVWRFLVRFAAPAAVGAIIVSVILGAEYQ